jgi:anaerobic magnesium-protoporphyrin IX monomethyl ester cyclase
MDREDVLKRVLKCYGRFYARKTFFKYPFIKDRFKRKYMFGCLKAFAKMTSTGRFYDIGRVQMSGQVNLKFDQSKIYTDEELVKLKSNADLAPDLDFGGTLTRTSRKTIKGRAACEAGPAEAPAARKVAKT